MVFLMNMLLFLFTLGVFWFAHKMLQDAAHGKKEKLAKMQEVYQEHLQQKEAVGAQLKKLDEQSHEIFTLYDMTREITKSFDESEALAAFVDKLKGSVDYQDCQLLAPLIEGLAKMKKDPGCFFVPLKGKKR